MVRVTGLSLDEFAAAAGLHPDLVRRLVALGLVDAASDAAGRSGSPAASWPRWPGYSGCAPASRLNYAAVGLVTDLLDRIALLETALRASRSPGRSSWTPIT